MKTLLALAVALILAAVPAAAQAPTYLVDGPGGTAVPVASGGAGDVDSSTVRIVNANDGMTLTGTGVTSAATTNATSVKASAGRLIGMWLLNETTTKYYIRFYNLATTPACNSATGFVQSFPIPPAAASGQVNGYSLSFAPYGFAFTTGIGYCITANAASTDNNAAAVGIYGRLGVK